MHLTALEQNIAQRRRRSNVTREDLAIRFMADEGNIGAGRLRATFGASRKVQAKGAVEKVGSSNSDLLRERFRGEMRGCAGGRAGPGDAGNAPGHGGGQPSEGP